MGFVSWPLSSKRSTPYNNCILMGYTAFVISNAGYHPSVPLHELRFSQRWLYKSFLMFGKMPCSPLKVNRSFGETYRLHHQVWISRESWQRESIWYQLATLQILFKSVLIISLIGLLYRDSDMSHLYKIIIREYNTGKAIPVIGRGGS
jgi:hypothetical protein